MIFGVIAITNANVVGYFEPSKKVTENDWKWPIWEVFGKTGRNGKFSGAFERGFVALSFGCCCTVNLYTKKQSADAYAQKSILPNKTQTNPYFIRLKAIHDTLNKSQKKTSRILRRLFYYLSDCIYILSTWNTFKIPLWFKITL